MSPAIADLTPPTASGCILIHINLIIYAVQYVRTVMDVSPGHRSQIGFELLTPRIERNHPE